MTSLYDAVATAVTLAGDRALIRLRTSYQPSGGSGARIYPPTYPVSPSERDPYVIETRFVDGVERKDVLLDSVPSQANRAEEALLRARREGRVELPLLEIHHDGATSVKLTSLELPHRYADAYLLDSLLDGEKFDRTPLGQAFQTASAMDATALFTHDPGSVVFGAWNSHRKGRQVKFPRIYASEIIGWDPQVGQRKAGRMDPLNLTGTGSRDADGELHYVALGEKAKGVRLSEIGHGNIAPNSAHGGVTVSSAERFATISLAGLNRLGFGPASREAAVAARACLAAYALLADRLAFGGPSLWLRSGCELVTVTETLEWVERGEKTEPIELTTEEAVALYAQAAERAAAAGLPMDMETITLTPGKGLGEAIDFALTNAETSGE
ncbi:MAG: type I-U CRISPR-associated RAMP protein Csb1/Cas7u [Actinomycetota bacterium]|jgi:CRISPR-associated protein Csb1|nr:type I-U CRISPR-associated RAMP protein Csb1/Cas7u [Actinomycetota bacterium]